ncbi:VirB3 family type IV secretion system protein [Chitinimonas sp. BJB300]|uniref:VirB3 family type IV secretion system protein n=1 Tax=Chitinimonas sp. BJB300 TaxID=1559339 RepID=UPI000C10AEB3|nr:VirB3 family type IV secretion system protein [Chitinimonas sp. BJB300]PHV12225.1 hypothetical protein CSQ89_06765 [Chitinimonas sp. BJB300]TSJ85200.1 hypothetical protein FG002_018035 [Chitinimonas sp. BJB300]
MADQHYKIEDPFYQGMTREANYWGTPLDFLLGNAVFSMMVLILSGAFAVPFFLFIQGIGALYTAMDPDGLSVLMGTLFQAGDGANQDIWGGQSYDV